MRVRRRIRRQAIGEAGVVSMTLHRKETEFCVRQAERAKKREERVKDQKKLGKKGERVKEQVVCLTCVVAMPSTVAVPHRPALPLPLPFIPAAQSPRDHFLRHLSSPGITGPASEASDRGRAGGDAKGARKHAGLVRPTCNEPPQRSVLSAAAHLPFIAVHFI